MLYAAPERRAEENNKVGGDKLAINGQKRQINPPFPSSHHRPRTILIVNDVATRGLTGRRRRRYRAANLRRRYRSIINFRGVYNCASWHDNIIARH